MGHSVCGLSFVTYSWVPRPLDSLLSISMKEGETLKNYSDRYWEIYNEIDGDFKDVVVQTFKVGFLHTLTYGNCLLWNCLGVWIGLRSLKGSRTTKTLAREKPRFSPLPEGIACRVDSHLLDWGGSFFKKKERLSTCNIFLGLNLRMNTWSFQGFF